ncbi:MAG: D-alanyl-D-alanine carboxypeptidase family protein [Oscillospiraceae bacterium]
MAEQTQIFDDSLKENVAEFTQKFVARPGCSEHQTSLAIDLGQNIPPHQ